ncbi:MAG: DUF4912 domain-containing protein [Candidatus Omnitrophota bacterium]
MILKKIKEILNKKIVLPNISSFKSRLNLKTKNASKKEVKISSSQEKSFEQRVEESKFYSAPEPHYEPRTTVQDLPGGYGKDQIILQVRDPWWVHAYWELTSGTWQRIEHDLGNDFHKAKKVLRVYDVSFIIFDGSNAHRFFDIEVRDYANNWYIDLGSAGRSWCVDYGLILPDGRFVTIIRSNIVTTPIEGPSWITDEEWMIPDDMFARLYGLGVGFGSSPVRLKKAWQERLKRELSSGALFSASPVKKPKELEKNFWLVVDTELIVYGATLPSAKVTIQGKAINLRPDGTFSVRFHLPDSKQAIPVVAVSSDGDDQRTIIPIVTRETKR